MLDHILNGINYEHNRIVILAHDSETKESTLAALPEIIEYFKNRDYSFGVISNNVDMSYIQFISY